MGHAKRYEAHVFRWWMERTFYPERYAMKSNLKTALGIITEGQPKMIVMLGGNPEMWGFIPSFFDLNDPRRAVEQIQAHYISGWPKFEGFVWDSEKEQLTYPNPEGDTDPPDPPLSPRSIMIFRDELVILFDYAWTMVMQKDGSWEIARLD